ncbi:MAG: UDP-N-acetylglucosamine 4,6-dehydratase (inverting) [Deltaproteobacteria bacterium]|nr:UDP-N-acetylglucosamine 4,6-dehydratase (inverting) [Candidatus Zymogenaceae bacterium]
MLNGKTILITGGTGSFGKKCVQTILSRYEPRRLIIFSRDELKQFEMSQVFSVEKYPCLRYFIGDVRDKERLHRAFHNVDYVIHAAALKQVPSCEYNPFEAIKTNIIGAENIINVAIDQGIKKIIALSTDKAANPINLYGATKLCADKLFIAANTYASSGNTRFANVRYGNVFGSRGSVIPFFLEERKNGVLPITDERMTRFWITLQRGVDFVLASLERMKGGELFIPKIPSMKIVDLARAIGPECELKVVGIRPGEKIHEVLLPREESRNAVEFDEFYVVQPDMKFFHYESWSNGAEVPEGFEYNSGNNTQWLTAEQMRSMIEELYPEEPVGIDTTYMKIK